MTKTSMTKQLAEIGKVCKANGWTPRKIDLSLENFSISFGESIPLAIKTPALTRDAESKGKDIAEKTRVQSLVSDYEELGEAYHLEDPAGYERDVIARVLDEETVE